MSSAFKKTGSIFAGISKAQDLKEVSTYFEQQGEYEVELIEATQGLSENPKRLNVPYVALKFRILKATQRGEDTPLSVGTEVSSVKILNTSYAMTDVKAFIVTVTGCEPGEVDADFADEFFADDGAAVVGTKLKVTVKARTAKDGRVFHNPYYALIEG